MKKRIAMLTAVLLCGVMLSACGGSGSSSESSAETEEAAVEENNTESAEAGEASEGNETEAVAGENGTGVAAGENVTDIAAGENGTEVAAGENGTEVAAGENGTDIAGGNETDVAGGSDENDMNDMVKAMVAEAEQDPLMSVSTIEGEYTIADCVKLGEYKGMELEKVTAEVTDEDIDTYINYFLQPVEITDQDAALEDGDTANLDFTGYLNDEPFEGGADTDFDLVIGSGMFIPGFEEQMIGMKVDEERDLNLTFPENYGSEELAGQDVVFHVKLNAIKRLPEADDEWVKTYTDGEYETLEEYRASIRKDLEEENNYYAESTLQNEAWNTIVDNSEVIAFPEELLKEKRDEYTGYLESEAEMYGVSAEEYIAQMGLTKEDFDKINEVQVRQEVMNDLILDALVEAENITEDDPEYQKELEKLSENYGMTADELKETYGEDAVNQRLKNLVVINRVLSYANITETTASEE